MSSSIVRVCKRQSVVDATVMGHACGRVVGLHSALALRQVAVKRSVFQDRAAGEASDVAEAKKMVMITS